MRKIIVAPNYKAIFDEPERFASQCRELGIELHQDLTALHDDISAPYNDHLLYLEWHRAIGITYDLYRTFRTIDSALIREIIRDLHGEFNPLDSYNEENPFTIEDMM